MNIQEALAALAADNDERESLALAAINAALQRYRCRLTAVPEQIEADKWTMRVVVVALPASGAGVDRGEQQIPVVSSAPNSTNLHDT